MAVRDGEVLWSDSGGVEQQTTNNRMELYAMIVALRRVPAEEAVTIFSDSNLCVQTLTKWAASWQRNNWTRKDGEVKNLDLVREAYTLAQSRPRVRFEWLRGHAGSTWNEYADRLAGQDPTRPRS